MEIIRESLKKGYNKVEKIKGAAGYALTQKGDKCFLIKSFDSFECRVSVDSVDNIEGKILLNNSILKTAISLKEKYIKVDTNDKILTTTKRTIKATTIDNNNVCNLGEIVNNIKGEVVGIIKVNAEEYKTLMEVVDFSSKEEVRPILKTVCFNGGEVCCINGYTLSLRRGNFNLKGEYCVNANLLKDTLKLIDKNTKEVIITFYNKFAEITIDDVTITTKLFEGKFIPYHSLLPSDYKTLVKVSKEELLEESKLLKNIVSSCDRCIKFDFKNKTVLSDSKGELMSTCLDTCIKEGEDLTIALDNDFLLKTLNSFKGENIIIKMKNSVSPMVFSCEGVDGINLIAPMRIAR